jgi:amidohydrolase
MPDHRSSGGELLADLQAGLPVFAGIRRDIHRHPETAYEEHRTARVVAEALASYGLEVTTGIGVTGVVGTLRSGDSDRAIGLRADMDALDLEELNDFAHRSVHAGKMHGCGHDGHTATMLAAAAHLARNPNFDGVVHFIFQPAEEGHAGARRMIDEGLFDRFPMEAVYGLHNQPGAPVGSFALKSGPVMAGADRFDIRIDGVGGHGAIPHLTSDPIVATGALIQALQTIVARNVDPLHATVLSITRVTAGANFNVIPSQAELEGTVRYFDEAARSLIQRRMTEIASHIAAAHGCRATIDYRKLFPATVNWPKETALCRAVLQDLVGSDRVEVDPQPIMASEDFAFMLEAKPGCYIWAGNGEGEYGCSVHNPHYDFNDALIPFGAAYWIRLVERALPVAP